MRKIIFTLTFMAAAMAAFAQEQATYMQYQVNQILVNPAYTGNSNRHEFIANARSAWAGFPGRPATYTVMYNGPVGDKLALGGGVFAEKIGDISTVKLQLNYAFRFQFQKAKIGLGLTTDFLRKQADASLQNDPTVELGDEKLEALIQGQSIFDATVGAHVLYDDKFFIDLTLPNTVRTRLDEVPVGEEETSSGLLDHYMFQLGYIANIPSQNFKLTPSLAVRRFRDTPDQIDLNILGNFMDDKLIAGITFRPSYRGAAAFLLGTSFNGLRLTYSYDVAFSRFQQYNGGSHELGVSYRLPSRGQKPAGGDANDLYN